MATVELKYLFKPKKTIRLFRCREDETLLTDKMLSEGTCAGHVVQERVKLTLGEKLKLMLGVIQ